MYYNVYPYYYYPPNYSYYSPYCYPGNQYISNSRAEVNYVRGTVKKIIFQIDYPDGTQKAIMLDNAHNITHIVFNQKYLFPEDTHLFNVSTQDWSQNPAMIAYRTNGQASPEYFAIDPTTGSAIAIDPTITDALAKPRPKPYCSSIPCGPGGAFDPDIKVLDPKILQPGELFDL